MDITIVESLTISEAWWKCIQVCLDHGYEYKISGGSSGTEEKSRKELDFVVVKIRNPGVRPLVPDVPFGVPSPTSDSYLQNYLDYLLTSMKQDNEIYTYGEYIEPQFQAIIDKYQRDGFDTNQACMTIGDKNSIYLVDPPCLKMIDTRIRDRKLHWVVYFRSWDLYGGFPTNIGGLQLAKEMMAEMIGVDDGELIAISKGLHLYDTEWEVAKMVVGRVGL